jgi:transglutaminase-like putative cysteine protease
LTFALRPLPRPLARVLSALVLVAWTLNMGLLVRHAWSSSPNALATDLAGYTPSAHWSGIYYRGEKIGFSVSQTTPTDTGYEMREDGRMQMSLLGSTTAIRLSSRAQVDRSFRLHAFSFSLDPGTGATEVSGVLDGARLALTVKTPSGTRSETRELGEPPALSLNLSRSLAARGLRPGQQLEASLFDPATLRNAKMTLTVRAREVVRVEGHVVPAFLVEGQFAGVRTRSWITDVGDVVREESAMGLVVVRETREQAQRLSVPHAVQTDLLEAAAVVPTTPVRIDDPTLVARLRVRLSPLDGFDPGDLDGAGQSRKADVIEILDPEGLRAFARPPDLERFLGQEPFIESDAPEIRAEAARATAGLTSPRKQAEALLRDVHALLEKKPTVSLPSAREVLRTRVGDCNEHTVLYVALARALGLPSRIAVGLVYLRGAFYYHAWPEVYVAEGRDRGLWLPVDPTLDQFPADATHIRLARGGLDRQASILSLIGRARLDVLAVENRPGATPVLVGRPSSDLRPLDLPLPSRDRGGCWSSPSR